MQPLCLVAHNGDGFDFIVLFEEIRRVGGCLDTQLVLLDSLKLFKSMPEVFGVHTQTRFLSPLSATSAITDASVTPHKSEIPNSTVDITSSLKTPLQQVCRRLQFSPSDTKTTITPPKVHYSLGAVYRRSFQEDFVNAHSAEGDCIALLQLFHKHCDKILRHIPSFIHSYTKQETFIM